jgi:hypothetical protein
MNLAKDLFTVPLRPRQFVRLLLKTKALKRTLMKMAKAVRISIYDLTQYWNQNFGKNGYHKKCYLVP